VIRKSRNLRIATICASVASGVFLCSATVQAEIPLTDPAKTDGWAVTTSGRVDSYLAWVFGQTVNTVSFGNLVDPASGSNLRYKLIGPQVGIQGNPTPNGAVLDMQNDTNVSAPRIRGGFASTILAFNISKQISPNIKLTFKLGLWAGIQNGLVPNTAAGIRQQNDVGTVDWRDQYMKLEGPWGIVWAGRLLGLFNRGGMRMDWYLIHQQGVGHPCNVDSGGTTSCGGTGVGSLHPARNAQLAYSTPDLSGFQLTVAVLDPSMIAPAVDNTTSSWNRTPYPRVEAEATFHKGFGGTSELNAWANGLSQIVGRTAEVQAQPGMPPLTPMVPGIPADKTVSVFAYGAGAWGRFANFALGGTGWAGKGLGTAFAFGNTAIDDIGTLRQHFGYLGVANYRHDKFEIATSYGSANARETDWDKNPDNPNKISVIKEVRGISGLLAYHMGPVTFSVDGMYIRNEWHRGEVQVAKIVSGGMLGEW
jgi:hypothetical protein